MEFTDHKNHIDLMKAPNLMRITVVCHEIRDVSQAWVRHGSCCCCYPIQTLCHPYRGPSWKGVGVTSQPGESEGSKALLLCLKAGQTLQFTLQSSPWDQAEAGLPPKRYPCLASPPHPSISYTPPCPTGSPESTPSITHLHSSGSGPRRLSKAGTQGRRFNEVGSFTPSSKRRGAGQLLERTETCLSLASH